MANASANPYANPAARVELVLKKFLQSGGGGSTPGVQVWSVVFGLPPEMPATLRHYEVTAHLRKLYDQVDAIRRRAAETDIGQERYIGQLSRIEKALLPEHLSNQANTVGQHLSADVFTALGFLAYILGSDEDEAPKAVLDTILEKLNEIDEALAGADISAEFRRAVSRLIDSIRYAIREYPITGAVSLRELSRRILFEWNDVPSPQSNGEHEVWKNARKIVHVATVIGGLVLGGLKGADAALHTLDDVHHILPVVEQEFGLKVPANEPKQIPSETSPEH